MCIYIYIYISLKLKTKKNVHQEEKLSPPYFTASTKIKCRSMINLNIHGKTLKLLGDDKNLFMNSKPKVLPIKEKTSLYTLKLRTLAYQNLPERE